MINKTLIRNAAILTPYRLLRDAHILMDGGKILDVGEGSMETPEGCEVIDAHGLYAAPGFIDIHIHGAGGCDFIDGTPEACLTIARTCAAHGATAIAPTSMPCDDGALQRMLKACDAAAGRSTDGAQFLKTHLEGPYLNPVQAGAADPAWLRPPTPGDFTRILGWSNRIGRWDIAPELDGALELGRRLVERGILPSIGHSDATHEQALEAFESGYSMITHLYSAMSGVHRINAFRVAGVIESAYLIDEMDVEIIADGCHLPASLLHLIYKIKGRDRIALITDSMRAAGTKLAGEYIERATGTERKLLIEDGVAKLPDRSAFAGSIATADRLVRTMVKQAGIPLIDAAVMASATPARIMGVSGSKGTLAPGMDADIVLFDDDIGVAMTIVGGKTVYRKQGGV